MKNFTPKISGRQPHLQMGRLSARSTVGSVIRVLRRPSAFTLVELLVAMAIFVTLAAIAISAWRGNDQDRVSNAAAIFKNSLEGAKSRAVKSGESRGVRLTLDPNNNRIVTSLIYVDGGRYESGNLFAEYDNRGTGSYSSNPSTDPEGYDAASSGRWRVACADTDTNLWNAYLDRGLIGTGTLIEIPLGQSSWFRFTGATQIIGGIKWWVLQQGDITGQTTSTTTTMDYPEAGRDRITYGSANPGEGLSSNQSIYGLPTSTASAAIPYRMQLLPAMLAGAEPISLPPNTCIDLDGSKVPTTWRPTVAKPKYGPPSGYMDILFSPRGAIDRPLTTEGILHFRLTTIGDLLLAQGASTNLPNQYAAPIVVTDPEHGAKLVSVITQTGVTLNADIYPSLDVNPGYNNDAYNFNDSTVTSDASITNPYYYALYGKEGK